MPRTLAFCKDVLDRNQREESKASTQLCVVQLGAFLDNKERPPTNLLASFWNRNPQARHLQLTKAGWTGKNKIRAGEGARMTWERPEPPNFFCSSFYLIAFGESEILFVFHRAHFRCTEDHRHASGCVAMCSGPSFRTTWLSRWESNRGRGLDPTRPRVPESGFGSPARSQQRCFLQQVKPEVDVWLIFSTQYCNFVK